MKLLLCNKCSDIFNLRPKEKVCGCGETKGRYLEDGIYAVYSGDCTPLGFANGSFVAALIDRPESGKGTQFTAFVMPKVCETFNKEQ